MIVERYDPMNLFEMVPKLNLQMEPELAHLDVLLDDDVLFARVKADLRRRYPNSARLGRHSTPVEVLLRMLVVKRLYGWSYEQTERFVSDSIVLRQFCRLYLEPTPDDTTLIRWANVIGAQTVAALNDRAVELAHSLKVTRGRKLRVDSMVVQTNIHHPTDSALLRDGVRVLSRLLRRAKKALPAEVVCRPWARKSSAPAIAASSVQLSGCTGSPVAKERRPVRSSKKLTKSSSRSPKQAVLRRGTSSKRCTTGPMLRLGTCWSTSSTSWGWWSRGSSRRPAVSLKESTFRLPRSC
jgi:transposase, IS5 family